MTACDVLNVAQINLIGGFSMIAADGQDLTPRGTKARAVLAILARSADNRRPRRWIESCLWSERATDQASGSLRQTLTEIRRAMGPYGDLLVTDRESVSLNGISTDIDVTREECCSRLSKGQKFFEGIDPKDNAFDDWLRQERSAIERELCLVAVTSPVAVTGPHQMAFTIHVPERLDGPHGVLATSLAETIGQAATHHLAISLFCDGDQGLPFTPPAEGIALTIRAVPVPDCTLIHASLTDVVQNRLLWAKSEHINMDGDTVAANSQFPQMVNECVEAAIKSFERSTGHLGQAARANTLFAQAISDTFSFESTRLYAESCM
ncbi:MAG: AfsR/SARP family transcriptional regulator [Planktomarina sp.]